MAARRKVSFLERWAATCWQSSAYSDQSEDGGSQARPVYHLSKSSHVRQDHVGGESGSTEVVTDSIALEAPFRPRLERDMHGHTRSEHVAARHHGADVGGTGSLGVATQPGLERDAEVGAHHQRVEELPAELPVSNPGLTISQPLKRSDVDEHRS